MPGKKVAHLESAHHYPTICETWAPTGYKVRDIVPSAAVSQWSEAVEKIQLENNRILQPGFLRRDARSVIVDAKVTKQDWLTDFACPVTEIAMLMNIAAKIVVLFKIDLDDLDTETQRIYQQLKRIAPTIEKDIEAFINNLIKDHANETQRSADLIEAKRKLTEKYPDLKEDNPSYKKTLDAFLRVADDIWLKQAIHQTVDKFLSPVLEAIAKELDIKRKTPSSLDYIILGPAASGKSTLLRQTVSPKQRENAIIFGTDYYRAVSYGKIDAHLSMEQVFIKTQDAAFMIKELVQAFSQNEVTTNKSSRPAIIYEGISYAPWYMDKLLEGRSNITVSIACLEEAAQIVPRAEQRARSSKSRAVEIGRQLNTTSLLEAHAYASRFLLERLPKNPNINLFNTSTHKQPPEIMASIDMVQNSIAIMQLDQMGRFLVKKNINTAATSKSSLFYTQELKRNRYQFTERLQASAILALISEGKETLSSISLRTNEDEEYAKIVKLANNKIIFLVENKELMIAHLQHPGSLILKELVLQTSNNYKDKISYLGANLCQKKAIEELLGEARLQTGPTRNS